MSLLFEHTEVQRIPSDIASALRHQSAKGYRKTKNGRYETFVSVRGKNINPGTFTTESEAEQAVFMTRANRFLKTVYRCELDVTHGKLTHSNYVAFPNGDIISLVGNRIYGHIDRCGYNEIILNGHQYRRHRVIAEAFVDNPDNKPFVNHKDGIKFNNRAENLEWVTRSENAVHSFRTGLQTHIRKNGTLYRVITPEEDERIKELHFAGHTDKQIAEQLKRSREAISKRIRRMGIR